MNQEQKEQVIDALVKFIIRVAEGNVNSEAETTILPDVVNTLDVLW